MTNSTFTLLFPENSGFTKSDIIFHQGNINLLETFNEEKTECKRLFVTDSTISSLPSVKPFIDSFEQCKLDCLESHVICGKKDSDFLIILGAGEAFKTIESVLDIVKAGLEFNLDRSSLFVAIGGGVICDMTGFAASMFKRGIDVEFVPTTLLAMVDASVGGKTGCDFEGYKNMIGAFWPAKKLHIFPDFIKTLPENEYVSGLSEAIKTALLFNKNTTEMFASNVEKVLSRDSDTLFVIIRECVEAKAAIVHEDFKEKGRRAFLNLGHTFGHALEAVAGLGKITHGEAVAWGMGRACDLSLNLGMAEKAYVESTKKMLASYGYDMNPFPAVLAGNGQKKDEVLSLMLQAMHKDKKNNASSLIRVTVQKEVENTSVESVTEEQILAVIQ